MRAGNLRERIEIEAEARVANGQGGWNTSWGKIAGAMAEIIGLSGDEALKAGIERNVQQWRVRIHRRESITTAQRIQWLRPGGVKLEMNIKSAMPDPKDPQMATLLICESGG